MNRNGYGSNLNMDQFTYYYHTLSGEKSNRLSYARDAVSTSVYDDDIKHGQSAGNYQYNRIGELTEDAQENMKLYWRTGNHKLQKIERTDQDSPEVEFFYNPLGIRVAKLVKPRASGVLLSSDNWTMHYYAYDANGQLMAVYDSKLYHENGETTLEEQYIYGASRVGVIKQNKTVYFGGMELEFASDYRSNILGKKRYELTNHLGNVLSTVSDRKVWNSTDSHYEAVVTMYADYYAFGMMMPNRFDATAVADTRHLFNGMEHDGEVSGSGNSYTTEFRQYDPRLGRWKSLDPVIQPFQSPYCGLDNNPVYYTDNDGRIVKPSGSTGKERREVRRDIRHLKKISKEFSENLQELEDQEETYYIGKHDNQNAETDLSELKPLEGHPYVIRYSTNKYKNQKNRVYEVIPTEIAVESGNVSGGDGGAYSQIYISGSSIYGKAPNKVDFISDKHNKIVFTGTFSSGHADVALDKGSKKVGEEVNKDDFFTISGSIPRLDSKSWDYGNQYDHASYQRSGRFGAFFMLEYNKIYMEVPLNIFSRPVWRKAKIIEKVDEKAIYEEIKIKYYEINKWISK